MTDLEDLTEDDFEATYRVLETLREDAEGVNEAMFHDVHYKVQLAEAEQ